jgi:secreted PhoX family phosphatase
VNRRHFLKNAGALALGFAGLQHAAAFGTKELPANAGFGPLLSDRDKIFDLPKGFSYQIISRSGEQMNDGFIVPRRLDAMAAFPGPAGVTLIVRNHEVNLNVKAKEGAFGKNCELLPRLRPELLYDAGKNGEPALGGTTTLVYDTRARRERLSEGGKLQALVVNDQPSLDTRNWEDQKVTPGALLRVKWIDLDEIESPQDDLRRRGFAQGAACFARGEGMWYGRDAVYFACTSGGREKKGQIWRYFPSPHEGTPEEEKDPGKLELFVEPNDGNLVENADNLTGC